MDTDVLLNGRHHYGSSGGLYAWYAAQLLGNQTIQAFGCFGFDFQEVRIGPGDVMTFEHLRKGAYFFGESHVVLRVLDTDPYEGRDVHSKLSGINPGKEPYYNSLLFKLPDSFGDGRLGESDRGSEVDLAHSSVVLKQTDKLIIYRVNGHMA
jgi:hypothetical protein